MKLCVIIKAGKILSASLVDDEHVYGVHKDHYHFYCPFTDEADCQEKDKENKAYGQVYGRDYDGTFD